jgi:hypothetical protein
VESLITLQYPFGFLTTKVGFFVMQEMFGEYSNLKQEIPHARLRVYLFPGTDDTCHFIDPEAYLPYPLSPEEYADQAAFLADIPDGYGPILRRSWNFSY